MNRIQSLWVSALLAALTGCNQEAPAEPSLTDSALAPSERQVVIVEPGRLHDFTSADPSGTLQFTVRSGSGADVPALLADRLSYVLDGARSIRATVEFSGTKDAPRSIVTVRAAEDIPADTWATVRVRSDEHLRVAGGESRAGAEPWSLRLFTGSRPEVVALRVDGTSVEVVMSEPVDWQEFRPSLAADGRNVELCVPVANDCVNEAPAELVGESLTFTAERALASTARLDLGFPRLAAELRQKNELRLSPEALRTDPAGGLTFRRALDTIRP